MMDPGDWCQLYDAFEAYVGGRTEDLLLGGYYSGIRLFQQRAFGLLLSDSADVVVGYINTGSEPAHCNFTLRRRIWLSNGTDACRDEEWKLTIDPGSASLVLGDNCLPKKASGYGVSVWFGEDRDHIELAHNGLYVVYGMFPEHIRRAVRGTTCRVPSCLLARDVITGNREPQLLLPPTKRWRAGTFQAPPRRPRDHPAELISGKQPEP